MSFGMVSKIILYSIPIGFLLYFIIFIMTLTK
jgi:hypothetical protein